MDKADERGKEPQTQYILRLKLVTVPPHNTRSISVGSRLGSLQIGGISIQLQFTYIILTVGLWGSLLGFPLGFPPGFPSGFSYWVFLLGFPLGFPSWFPPGLPSGFPTGFPSGFPPGFPSRFPPGYPFWVS